MISKLVDKLLHKSGPDKTCQVFFNNLKLVFRGTHSVHTILAEIRKKSEKDRRILLQATIYRRLLIGRNWFYISGQSNYLYQSHHHDSITAHLVTLGRRGVYSASIEPASIPCAQLFVVCACPARLESRVLHSQLSEIPLLRILSNQLISS